MVRVNTYVAPSRSIRHCKRWLLKSYHSSGVLGWSLSQREHQSSENTFMAADAVAAVVWSEGLCTRWMVDEAGHQTTVYL